MSLDEKLKEAEAMSKRPVELSDPEKEILTNIVSTLKDVLDQVLEDALKLTRDEAFKKINSYVQALIDAPRARQAVIEQAVEGVEEKKPQEPMEQKPMAHPVLVDLLRELPEDKQERARIVLNCIKQYNKLEADGEEGRQALCPECTPEKMRECINVEDPKVVDGIDKELREAGVLPV
ncbi:hypothetical protein LCGC14_0497370 [marine sediment metagenome]|uniref:Uncharacterized protein n=1 Tax=marine sediment metagenome TaxID=412755 RepID=A0A0F9SA18_9ZZZZ